jgi:hypothetical protein
MPQVYLHVQDVDHHASGSIVTANSVLTRHMFGNMRAFRLQTRNPNLCEGECRKSGAASYPSQAEKSFRNFGHAP